MDDVTNQETLCTRAQDVIESFESSFADKKKLPFDLELMWLKKAIARYSAELYKLNFDVIDNVFDSVLDQYVIDTLAVYMKQLYQERETSRVNKRVSIVTKSLSIDGTGNAKTAAKNELDYDAAKSDYMTWVQKPAAYI